MRWRFAKRLHRLTYTVTHDIHILWRNPRYTSVVMGLNLLHTLLYAIWIYWAATTLRFSIPVSSLIMLALILKTSIIFRVTPGNLGVEQIVSGSILLALGGKLGDGVSISLLTKMSNMLLVFSLGFFANFYYMKHFDLTMARIKTYFSKERSQFNEQ